MSESHTIISDIISDNLNAVNLNRDLSFGNWSTAVNTRSLSFILLPRTEASNNPILNLGLLFYENPTGKLSALLQRDNSSGYASSSIEWIDITSQGSRSLPDAFRNDPSSDNNNSNTLYESDTNTTFSTPFTCTANFSNAAVQLLFYSPNATDPIGSIDYDSDRSGDYTFSKGMYYAYSNPQ